MNLNSKDAMAGLIYFRINKHNSRLLWFRDMNKPSLFMCTRVRCFIIGQLLFTEVKYNAFNPFTSGLFCRGMEGEGATVYLCQCVYINDKFFVIFPGDTVLDTVKH